MTSVFDPRIIQVTIYFEDGPQTFEGLSINAFGQKFDAAIYNECQLSIFNLTKEQRNYILTRTSPWQLQRKNIRVTLDVGRESYGTFRLFDGQIYQSQQSQPPDIGITMISYTNSFQAGVLLSQTESSTAQLKIIAQKIADNNGKILEFFATDKQIENFIYNGVAAYQIRDLNEIGGIIASIDNDVLTVRDAGKPLSIPPKIINAANGMVGIPMIIATGVSVRTMIDSSIKLGSLINIESQVLPMVNGQYVVQKILFEVASRDQPFWYTIDAILPQYYAGTIGS